MLLKRLQEKEKEKEKEKQMIQLCINNQIMRNDLVVKGSTLYVVFVKGIISY
jgi:hypothetical protein